MASYPALSTVPEADPYEEEIEWRTLTSHFDDLGEEQRKQKWLYPKRNLNVKHNYITKDQGRTVWQFYLSRKGSYEAFNYFVPNTDTYTSEYVGTGDSTTTIFNLPSKTAAAYTMYQNGSALTTATWAFSSGGGTDGADKATFSSAPAAGKRLTFSFTGQLKIHCRFAEDKMGFEQFYNSLLTTGIKLKGLLNE